MDTRTIEERKVILKRSLFEDNVLYMERLVIWYSVTKEFWPKTIKKPDFTLEVDRKVLKHKRDSIKLKMQEVTEGQITEYRQSDIPILLMKKDGKLLLTEIPTDVNIFTLAKCLGTHKCGKVREECKRLLALPDEKGGCEKVRNHSSFLERYPWIKEGYETFNTRKDIFVVKKCEHYVSTSK